METTIPIGKEKGFISKHMEIITRKTGINAVLVLGALIASLVVVVLGIMEREVTSVVGIVLPAIWSLKAIETSDKEDDKQWLTYWTVFGSFIVAEMFLEIFIRKYIPFYFLIKIVFLMWLFLPNLQGAKLIYDKVLYVFFKRYETTISKTLDSVENTINKTVQKGTDLINSEKKGTIKKAM